MSCPHCGYCEHCGRSNGWRGYPWGVTPYWGQSTWTTGGNYQAAVGQSSKAANFEGLKALYQNEPQDCCKEHAK